MNKMLRTAARMAAPRLIPRGFTHKRSVDKAERWVAQRANPAVARVPPTRNLLAKGLVMALLALPIGFWLGRRLLGRRS